MAELILDNVKYRYRGAKIDTLKGANATFKAGTLNAILGHSGAGKSTLLYLISGLDSPSDGQILLDGESLKKSMLDKYRRNTVATISQSYLLFETRTALENVLYPMELTKLPKDEAVKKAKEYLLMVGIAEELHNRLPKMLSGGEQQRVAIARCLAANSEIIAADEPTGNLDEETANSVMDLLLELAHEHGKNIILVTHDPGLAVRADTRYRLEKGVLREDDKLLERFRALAEKEFNK